MSRVPSRTARPRPTARPALEPLEDRTVPSYVPAAGAACTHGGCCPCCTSPAAEYRFGGSGSSSTVGATRWPQSALGKTVTITYSYSNLLNGALGGGLSAGNLKAVIEEALGRWAAVAPLKFVEVADSGPSPSTNDYAAAGRPMLRFGHLPIDGRYNVLAYAYFPGTNGLAGDVLFDTAERWALTPVGGTDLLEVATHEIGHALGLDHQPTTIKAIMNPLYAERYGGLGTSFLLSDDVAGIRALYGTGTGSVTPLGGGSGSAPGDPPPSDPGGNPPSVPPQNPAFQVFGTTLFVRGTSRNDTFRYSGGPAPVIEVNGASYGGSLGGITTIRFEGGGGLDVLTLAGGTRAEAFTLTAGVAMVSGGEYAVEAVGLRTIVAAGGAGDRLVLNGTAGKDAFTAAPSLATLASGRYRVTAVGFTAVTVNGAARDTVALYDSAGDDVLTATPAGVMLSGPGYGLSANGFARVNAYASVGTDRATLTGSAGDDVFIGKPMDSWLRGPGYFNFARGFDRVTADAGGGGSDAAYLYDSTGNDVYTASPAEARMAGPGYENAARGFDRTFGYSRSGGLDRATLYDSALDDVFLSAQRVATLTGEGFYNKVFGFRAVDGLASGGNDRAVITGGRGNDLLSGSGDGGSLARGTDTVTFTGFESVRVTELFGYNRKALSAIDFTLVLLGRWW